MNRLAGFNFNGVREDFNYEKFSLRTNLNNKNKDHSSINIVFTNFEQLSVNLFNIYVEIRDALSE